MSKWTHNMCMDCWVRENGDRTPTRLIDADTEVCCFCGSETSDGIFVRAEPQDPPCH